MYRNTQGRAQESKAEKTWGNEGIVRRTNQETMEEHRLCRRWSRKQAEPDQEEQWKGGIWETDGRLGERTKGKKEQRKSNKYQNEGYYEEKQRSKLENCLNYPCSYASPCSSRTKGI